MIVDPIPPTLILTAGEVMFSITGLEFAYSQAPPSMKAICQAAWLWTVAFGNLFVIIVAETSLFANQVRSSRGKEWMGGAVSFCVV